MTSSSSPPPARSPPTTSRPAIHAGSARHGGGGYSSPQLATIDGVPQILLLNGDGAMSVAPGRRQVALEARVGGRQHRAAGASLRMATS